MKKSAIYSNLRDFTVICETCLSDYNNIGTNTLKEYYEIVGESRPLLAFDPKHDDFTEMHF